MYKLVGRVSAFVQSSVVLQKAGRAFVAAVVPLVVAAYFGHGSFDKAFILSVAVAGFRAVMHTFSPAKSA